MSEPAMSEALVCTPLRVEHAALRGALHGVEVARSGMGPARSGRFAERFGPRPILVAGLGGALTDDTKPGDVVVATEVRGGSETVRSLSAPLLAGALRRTGLRVQLGPIRSTAGLVGEAARSALAHTGACAVDMESAQLARAAATSPFAVLRTIVDTPAHPLLHPGTAVHGLQALRSLRAAAPAVQQWADALGRREVLLAGVLRERFPALSAPRSDDTCYATTNRQLALRAVTASADLVLVLGSPNSSNSRRLAEVAQRAGRVAHLVDDAGDVDLRWLTGTRRIGITAGASAPPHLVDELVECLSGLGPLSVREVSVVDEDVRFTLPREVT